MGAEPKRVLHPCIERAPPTLPFPHRGGRVQSGVAGTPPIDADPGENIMIIKATIFATSALWLMLVNGCNAAPADTAKAADAIRATEVR